MTIGVLLCGALLVWVGFFVTIDIVRSWHSDRHRPLPVMSYRESSAYQDARPVEPWTPEEREAFGINDTEEFIRKTDAILRGYPDPDKKLVLEVESVAMWPRLDPNEAFVQTSPGVWEQQ